VLIGFGNSCRHESEFIVPLTINNRTNDTIYVYIKAIETEANLSYIGEVGAKRTEKIRDSHIWWSDLSDHLIEARSDIGEVIFSKVFSANELESLEFKIKIE